MVWTRSDAVVQNTLFHWWVQCFEIVIWIFLSVASFILRHNMITYALINPLGILRSLFLTGIGSGAGSGVLGFSTIAGSWNRQQESHSELWLMSSDNHFISESWLIGLVIMDHIIGVFVGNRLNFSSFLSSES